MPDTWSVDNSIEATFGVWQDIEIGLKGEIFNTTDQQDATNNNRTAWCADNSTTCQTRRNEWGAQTSRDSFRAPRSYRITGLIRF